MPIIVRISLYPVPGLKFFPSAPHALTTLVLCPWDGMTQVDSFYTVSQQNEALLASCGSLFDNTPSNGLPFLFICSISGLLGALFGLESVSESTGEVETLEYREDGVCKTLSINQGLNTFVNE